MPVAGKFKGVGQQIFQDLLQPLGVGRKGPRQGFEFQMEGQILRLGDVAEIPFHALAQSGERHFFSLHRHRAGFDFRQVENVVDEVEQIRSGAMDILGKLDLFAPTDCRRYCRRVAGRE